jgi:hypothetical protein
VQVEEVDKDQEETSPAAATGQSSETPSRESLASRVDWENPGEGRSVKRSVIPLK